MQYKIAAGSRDGKVVTEHFGGCGRFLIIEVDSERSTYTFAGFRPVTPPCADRSHDQNALENAAQALSDCRIVLVSRIGPPAEIALKCRGIDAMEYYGLIRDAMKRILQFYQ